MAASTAAVFSRVRGQRGDPDRDGVGIVVLTAMAGGQHPHPGREFRRDIDDVDAVGVQPLGQWSTQA